MNKPQWIAAVCAALPACTALATPPGTESRACLAQDRADKHPPPATGALPARAATGPTPERGTVAPSTRVASHVVTPSMRAMEKANAVRDAQVQGVDKKTRNTCREADATDAPSQGKGRAVAP